jgi:hypothetical protein
MPGARGFRTLAESHVDSNAGGGWQRPSFRATLLKLRVLEVPMALDWTNRGGRSTLRIMRTCVGYVRLAGCAALGRR